MVADDPTLIPSPPAAPAAGGRDAAWWLGWRLRVLLLAVLAFAVGLAMLVRMLAAEPQLAAQWRADAAGRLLLLGADEPALAARRGQPTIAIVATGAAPVPLDALALQHLPRWLPDDTAHDRRLRQDRGWRAALAGGGAVLRFADGGETGVRALPRGLAGIGLAFWPLAALAALLWVGGWATLLARLQSRVVPYLVLAWSQSAALLLLAVASVPGPGVALGLGGAIGPAHAALDLVGAAAAVHGAALHPRVLAHARLLAAGAWALALLVAALVAAGRVAPWDAVQPTVLALGACAVALLGFSHARQPHPVAPVLQRFGAIAVGALALLSVAALVQPRHGDTVAALPLVGIAAWHVFVAALLLALPLLPVTRRALREFVLIAGVAAVAMALQLLFGALFDLDGPSSVAAAIGAALALYAGARRWLARPLAGPRGPDPVRLFDHLLQAARTIESQPRGGVQALHALCVALFEPGEVAVSAEAPRHARVRGGGSTLVVPLPAWAQGDDAAPRALVLRHAQRGQRLFTRGDARLAERALAQLARAVSFGDAVEQGRREERVRLAQDLHDDIGARLLTLMYQAPTPQMEDYLRHTLQDLKTLTRGLAASGRGLDDAGAEWKTDLGQRLQVAHVELAWSLAADREVELGVVAWSALTRLLRELVTNVIAHAHATRVEVEIAVDGAHLTLQVTDDGDGGDPRGWAAGLGLSSVRKRVRQLGGSVEWCTVPPQGIRCRVVVPLPAASVAAAPRDDPPR